MLSESGQWERPLALCVLDDHSRLCCHAQWYLSETAEDLVHGLSQAFQKRGLPRALMTDNGSAMLAEEFQQGLERLSVLHQPTLPYSPYQNGKQEAFWGTLEGRLMEMLTNCKELSLDFLNEATQAWVEMEYNRREHSEIDAAPVARFLHSPDVLRDSPSSAALRDAFRLQTIRMQRRSDGTISVGGVRFELPSRFRHFRQVTVRLARWDLSRVDLIDPESEKILSPIYPLDRQTNADGRRARVEPLPNDSPADSSPQEDASGDEGLPPLLKKILKEYSATGLPPAYLPKRLSKPVSDDSVSDDSVSNDSNSNDSNEQGEI